MLPSNRFPMLGFAVAVLGLVGIANAQTQRGQIVGRITDTTGAAIPKAKIEVANPATGVTVKTVTNTEGLYTVPYLQYGAYRLTAVAAGFAVYQVSDVEISTATTTTVDASLAVAGTSDQVSVVAN